MRALSISLLFFFVSCHHQARTESLLTVCNSGCQYQSIQAAVNAAQPDSIIEIAAGETFTENIRIGLGKRRLTLRSSAWRDLPAEGYRVDPQIHAALMPTIQSPNAAPAMLIGLVENVVVRDGIQLETGLIRFEYADPPDRFSEGSEVACFARGAEFAGELPAPIAHGTKYWLRDWNPTLRQGRLSETPGGPPIALTSVGSSPASNYYSRPACALWDHPRNITLLGLRFAKAADKTTRTLLQIGNNSEADPVHMGPHEVSVRHSIVTGLQDDPTGPLFGIAMFGGHRHSVTDSWVGHCKRFGEESKALSIMNTIRVLVRNNYLSSASINVLTAGGEAASRRVTTGLRMEGNYLEKPGYMMFKSGSGEPSGSCYYGGGSGAFYLRTDVSPNTCENGACYTCRDDNTWQVDTSAVYRNQNYFTKNLFELKDCEDCLVEGNMLRGSYGGPDTGQGWCFGVSVVGMGYHYARNVTIRNNWADSCLTGIAATQGAYGGSFDQRPLQSVTIENNLLTNLGWFPALSQFTSPLSIARYGLKQSSGSQGFRFINNTIRAREPIHTGVLLFTSNGFDPVTHDYVMENNIFGSGTYTMLLDALAQNCTQSGIFQMIPNNQRSRIQHNLFYFSAQSTSFLQTPPCVSSLGGHTQVLSGSDDSPIGFTPDSRIASASPFSANHPSPVLVSNHGADLGADIDVIRQFALAAEKGEPSSPALIHLDVLPGSEFALFRFRRPASQSCEVSLYRDGGPRLDSKLSTDTASTDQRRDNRTSSLLAGDNVEFVAGAEARLQPGSLYLYKITCGSHSALGRFRTLEPATGARLKREFRHPSAHSISVEISTSPDFTQIAATHTALFSGGTAVLNLPFPSGYRYWRWTLLDSNNQPIQSGPAAIFVSP